MTDLLHASLYTPLPIVLTPQCKQGLMGTGFDDFPSIQNDNVVAVDNG